MNAYQRALTTLRDMRAQGIVPAVTIVNVDGEFQVESPDGHAAGMYFTTDKKDAEETARAVWGGLPLIIKHRKQR